MSIYDNLSTNTNNVDEYCFFIPDLPYTRRKPRTEEEEKNNPHVCYSSKELSEEHLQKVQNICAAYSKCQYIICKDYAGRPVMCPNEKHYYNSCLYSWARLGLDTPQEKEFLKHGEIFQNNKILNQVQNITRENIHDLAKICRQVNTDFQNRE